jgi:hypothetical protein
MMQMTDKKTKALEERGMKKVGYILQGENGQLAYVEGAAVRWLGAEQRDVFMFEAFEVKDGFSPFALISEINEYLNTNELTNIACGSILHQKCKDILQAQEQAA